MSVQNDSNPLQTACYWRLESASASGHVCAPLVLGKNIIGLRCYILASLAYNSRNITEASLDRHPRQERAPI